jgi:hypothetical protein
MARSNEVSSFERSLCRTGEADKRRLSVTFMRKPSRKVFKFGSRVERVTTMEDQVDASIVPERLIAALSGVLGALSAVLAAIGLYGLLTTAITAATPMTRQ